MNGTSCHCNCGLAIVIVGLVMWASGFVTHWLRTAIKKGGE